MEFYGKSDIGVTVLVCDLWCVHGCRWEIAGGEREGLCASFHAFVLVCISACLCVCVWNVFALCVPITCECSYKLCGCIGVWVVRVLECTFIYSRYPLPSFWQAMVHFWRTLLSIWNTADCDLWPLYQDLCWCSHSTCWRPVWEQNLRTVMGHLECLTRGKSVAQCVYTSVLLQYFYYW